MYQVTVTPISDTHNQGPDVSKTVPIHDEGVKLLSGSVVQGINAINSFTFTLPPTSAVFNAMPDYITFVDVFDTVKQRYEFCGRVLCSVPSMEEDGTLAKEVTCESLLAYLRDSEQTPVDEASWTRLSLLTHILDVHNAQVELYKEIRVGTVDNPNDKLDTAIARENSWDSIQKLLIDKLGGELRLRKENGILRLDYLTRLGKSTTPDITLGRNMRSISLEVDPSDIITRLIPLGAKKGDGEERWGCDGYGTNGKHYIEDAEWVELYGIHVKSVVVDEEETSPSVIASLGSNWMAAHNKVPVKYSVTALDLSLLGLDINDFEVGNEHTLRNKLLDISEPARIVKKTINVCDETSSSFELGDRLKTASLMQKEQIGALQKINADVAIIKRDYVTNKALTKEVTTVTQSIIQQSEEDILVKVSAGYISNDRFNTYTQSTAAKLELKVGKDDNDQIVSMLNASADNFSITAGGKLTIDSPNFTLDESGNITAKGVNLTGSINAYNSTFRGTIEVEAEDASGNTTSRIGQLYLINQYYMGDDAPAGILLNTAKNALGIGAAAHAGIEFYKSGSTTWGAYAANGTKYAKIHMHSGGQGTLFGTWTLSSGASVTSDRNAKNSIEGLSDKYEAFFDRLAPVRFKYNNGTSGRYHTGFIAQDVESALADAGLDTSEAGVLVKFDEHDGEGKTYALRYEELIALNTWQIQRLKERIAALEEEANL